MKSMLTFMACVVIGDAADFPAPLMPIYDDALRNAAFLIGEIAADNGCKYAIPFCYDCSDWHLAYEGCSEHE